MATGQEEPFNKQVCFIGENAAIFRGRRSGTFVTGVSSRYCTHCCQDVHAFADAPSSLHELITLSPCVVTCESHHAISLSLKPP